MLNFIDKFKTKNKIQYCKHIHEILCFDYSNNVRLCPYFDFGIIKNNFDGLWLDIEDLKSKRSDIISQFNSSVPIECDNCCNIEYKSYEQSNYIKELHLNNWKQCYISCRYCNSPKFEDLLQANHYDIFPILKQLIDAKIVNTKTKVVFNCGDACIHPEFDKILFYFINYEMQDIVINTPALRFCESVAQAISKNIAEVIISLDSGCPYIYKEVKGVNKFDIVLSNIKRYLEYQEPNQKRVVLKYNVLNGINDNQKEILDWFILSRDLGVKKLYFDVDIKWYNQIKYGIPKYLTDLILFTKSISEYNNLEIQFGEVANAIYNLLKKEEM